MTQIRLSYGCVIVAALGMLAVGGCPSAGTDGAGGDDGVVAGIFGGLTGVGGQTNSSPDAVVSATPASGIRPGVVVTLDASASSDPNGDALSFSWSQVSGMTATLSAADGAVVTFAAPYAVETEVLTFAVTVNDGRGLSDSAEVSVVIEVASEFAGHPDATSSYRESLTSDEAYHLLRRASLAATPDQVSLAVQRGLSATVDDLLIAKPIPQELLDLEDTYEENTRKRWMARLIEGPNPLHERLAMFWHDRFATSQRVIEDYRDRTLGNVHLEMLRANALGNYAEFLENLTLDPLMLIWLNGENSPKTDPNENYAREFWELFTLGRDVLYTEADIREAARAFTGMDLLRDNDEDTRPIFDIKRHDETPKLIFPARATSAANYNYETVISLTLAQPEAARYVARNLFVFFVHDHPSDVAVQELADYFVASNFQIGALVRRILTSQALFSPDASGNQVSTPVEHFVGVARTLQMHIHSEDSQGYILDQIVYDLIDAGQELLNPPGVEGWHEDAAWLQDQWVLQRIRALGRTMEYGPNFDEELPYWLLPATTEWVKREVRDQIVDAVAAAFHLNLTPEEHEVYVEVLDQGGWKAFHLEDPRYQPQHVREMIRLMAMDERVIGR